MSGPQRCGWRAGSAEALGGAGLEHPNQRSDRTIADLAARRAEARHRRATLLEEIRALRESETYEHPEIASGYRGTLAQIARRIAETGERDGWVSGYARGDLPLSAAEFGDLLGLLQEDSPERRARRSQRLPEADQLMAADRFESLVATVAHGDEVRAGADGSLVAVLEQLAPEALRRLDPVCAAVVEATEELRRLPALTQWALRASDMLLSGNGAHPWRLAVGQLPLVTTAQEHDRLADLARVQVASSVDPAEAAAVFEALAAHLSQGGTLRRVLKSTEQKNAERLGDAVFVNGAVPVTARTADAAARHLRVLEVANRINTAFHPLRMGVDVTADRPVMIEALLGLQRASASVDRLLATAAELRQLLAPLPPQSRPALHSVAALDRVAAVVWSVTRARSAAIAQAEIDEAAAAVLAGSGPGERAPETLALVDAMRNHQVEGYEHAIGGLDRARRQQADQLRSDELLGRLRTTAAALADEAVATPGHREWALRLERWPEAWARACAASWIAEQTTPGRERRLEGELNATVADVNALTAQLAAERAWRSSLARMDAEQVQALQIYRNAMTNVGRGTGKYAERFRRDARGAMAVAQSAVPAWVMPIQQVLASVPPQPGTFDVVIVDEASQADLTSSFLLWLAPRVIVVGDDKQCTPSEVASGALQPVFDRLDAELHDVPSYLRSVFTPRDSIFSMLRTKFGQVVRLREHFRCMPEIITWSSNMFYRDAPLVPLRQFGADRLPPLRATYVPGAETEPTRSSYVNRVEAEAIAESVVACLSDPGYDGATFGVVVLQGQPQVDLIDHELKKRVSDSDWRERRLRVGTPPDFQGDERHVVWLSMVAAPNSPLRALTGRNFEQSYNVAASRAQDQMWLFHSVSPDQLSQRDLRHSLLTYVVSEGTSVLEPVLTDVDPDRRHPRFDSLFEQRVFLDLVARGYHVTPQVESNRRRIDLVVTGAAGKLAVECDGDAFHGTPEQHAADLDREQELKRCGWTFERIRESVYYLDREAALAPVWATVDRLGIGPLGEVVDGVWVPLSASPMTAPPDADLATDEPPAIDSPEVVEIPEVDAVPDAVVAEPATAPDPAPVPEPRSVLVEDEPAPEPARSSEPVVVVAERRSEAPPASLVQHSVAEPASAGIDPEDRELLLRGAARQPLTTTWVVETLVVSTVEARALLQSMVENGLLRRTGMGRGTRYVLPDWTESESELKGPRRFVLGPDQRMQVLRAARHRPLSNEAVRRLLNVTAGQAVEVLSALVHEGLLDRNGRGRGTYYVLATAAVPDEPTSDRELTSDLAAEFDVEMRRLYQRALDEAGYKATRFLSLLSEHGGVATARQFLAAGSVSHGFTELWERRRLDLTVEALVLQSRFGPLFREYERETARRRLSSYGFVPQAD